MASAGMLFTNLLAVNRRRLAAGILGSGSLSGLAALWFYFHEPSEAGSAVLFGLSPIRLAIGGVFLLAIVGLGLVTTLVVLGKGENWIRRGERLRQALEGTRTLFGLLTGFYLLALGIGLVFALAASPLAWPFGFLAAVVNRFGILLGWLLLVDLLLAALVLVVYARIIFRVGFWSPGKSGLWFVLFLGVYLVFVQNYQVAAYRIALKKFAPSLIYLGLLVLAWSALSEWLPASRLKERLNTTLTVIAVFSFTYVLYQHYTLWMDWTYTPAKAYWDVLAQSFLEGRLYLVNPQNTHDLTFYHGNWYVPNPPLPTLLMLPYVLWAGLENTSTILFSIFFSALNSVLVFLLLDQMVKKDWIRLSRSGVLWLVAFFAFGTSQFWVGTNGKMWFVSQVVTVTFIALAALMVLRGWTPWLVGASLGLALWSRPSVLLIWPLLLGIFLQLSADKDGKIDARKGIAWSLKTAFPLALSVVGLLLYNQVRFGNYLDTGYLTINASEEISRNVRTYGLFNPHFLPTNLWVMFFNPPEIHLGSNWPITPSHAGMSMFLASPPLLYLIHKFRRQWWVNGAWLAIFLTAGALAMYHNTGSAQFGYRYLLDFIVPVLMLLASALGKKVSWIFALLVVVSIVFQVYGAVWFWST